MSQRGKMSLNNSQTLTSGQDSTRNGSNSNRAPWEGVRAGLKPSTPTRKPESVSITSSRPHAASIHRCSSFEFPCSCCSKEDVHCTNRKWTTKSDWISFHCFGANLCWSFLRVKACQDTCVHDSRLIISQWPRWCHMMDDRHSDHWTSNQILTWG